MPARFIVKCGTAGAYNNAVTAVTSGTALGIAVSWWGGANATKHDASRRLFVQCATADGAAFEAAARATANFVVEESSHNASTVAAEFERHPWAVAMGYALAINGGS